MNDGGMTNYLEDGMGKQSGSISVEISTRFLEHFSEQLYSSPQKAFEELVANGWDAGAALVDVRLSEDLSSPNATLAVFDDGESMDEDGLRELWQIAFSPKEHQAKKHGRKLIGKFGIGKLATYVLANKLTYICKAADGVIRRVTMDYGDVDRHSNPKKLVSDLDLDLFEVSQEEVYQLLEQLEYGHSIKRLLEAPNMPDGEDEPEESSDQIDEFGVVSKQKPRKASETWTLVILSELKDTGRNLQVGRLRRMLEAALPMSSELAIQINGDLLSSSKSAVDLIKSWRIGPSLGFSEFLVDDETGQSKETVCVDFGEEEHSGELVEYAEVPGIGRVTGTISLFEEKISGGKSEDRGYSNGFLVNVLGRVVNQDDPTFGAENHSHAAWSRFRMAVRADGLNKFLVTNREQFRSSPELRTFRAFLRKCFNLARSAYDSDANSELSDGGDILVKSLGVMSLAPLRSAVTEALGNEAPIPSLFDRDGVGDLESARENWKKNTSDHIRNALQKVGYARFDDDELVKFRLSDSSIIVNKDHPFVVEHSRTKSEKELMRTIAMVSFLSDIYALESGVDAEKVESIRQYRDQLMRFRALQRRKSGTYIAHILLETQHKSDSSKEFEKVLGDALVYIGFKVQELGGSGDPEGVAEAVLYRSRSGQASSKSERSLYSFTFDAKSTKSENAKTGNLSLDGIASHREKYGAQYALVVAPGFQEGAVTSRCTQLGITPMKASDLGRLLKFTAANGAIPLDRIESIFELHDPDSVSEAIEALLSSLKDARVLTIDVFLRALEGLRGKVPDVLEPGLIAYSCREHLGVELVDNRAVLDLVRGLSILVPDLVGLDGEKQVIVNASPERVAEAVKSQLEQMSVDE